MQLSHVTITRPPGSDAQARAFYTGLLGLPEVPAPELIRQRGALWFNAGALDLHLVVEADRAGADLRRHFGLDCADVTKMRARLDSAGFKTEDGRPAPWHRFFVNDPFGNRIEIHEIGGLRA